MLLERENVNPKRQLLNMGKPLLLVDKYGREGVVKVLAEHAGVNPSLK